MEPIENTIFSKSFLCQRILKTSYVNISDHWRSAWQGSCVQNIGGALQKYFFLGGGFGQYSQRAFRKRETILKTAVP